MRGDEVVPGADAELDEDVPEVGLDGQLPSQNLYREISSCSDCGTFQARRAAIRTEDQGWSAGIRRHHQWIWPSRCSGRMSARPAVPAPAPGPAAYPALDSRARRCRSPVISNRSGHLRRALAIHRSAMAFARAPGRES